jgi:hypothetical protein
VEERNYVTENILPLTNSAEWEFTFLAIVRYSVSMYWKMVSHGRNAIDTGLLVLQKGSGGL